MSVSADLTRDEAVDLLKKCVEEVSFESQVHTFSLLLCPVFVQLPGSAFVLVQKGIWKIHKDVDFESRCSVLAVFIF